MAINESILILDYCFPQYITTIALSPNCTQVSESSLFTQIFPIITLIIGSFLTFLADLLFNKLQERKELRRYEYVLIDDILDIIREDNKIDLLVKFYNSQKKDPRFFKIKHYSIIIDFIQTTIHGDTPNPDNLKNIQKELSRNI